MDTNINAGKMSNFVTRLISATIIVPPVFLAIYAGGILYFALLLIVIFFAGYEWNNLCGRWSFGIDTMVLITVITLATLTAFMDKVLYSFIIIIVGAYITYLITKMRLKADNLPVIPNYLNRPLWFGYGCLYLSIGFASMGYLINFHMYTIMWVLFATIANDVFAYIFGTIIGGKKILPKVSPGKSWAGFFGGVLGAILVSYLFALFIGRDNEIVMIIIGFFIAVFAHVGDFMESGFKRYVNVKDSSNLIPGHGGILDRIDAILATSIFIACLCFLFGKTPLIMVF